MSLQAMELVWKHSRSTGTARVVLLAIADHDGDGGAWPSIATLARHANVDPRSVQRHIQKLVDLGELVVHVNAGGSRGARADQRPNLYEITVQPVDKSRPEGPHGVTEVSPRDSNGVTLRVERGDSFVANGVTELSPEPSLNRPEPSDRDGRSGRGIDPSLWTTDVASLHRRWQAIPELAGLPQPFRPTRVQHDELHDLIGVHGIDRLVAVAVAGLSGQRGVRGFLHIWRALPAPGPTTTGVLEPLCDRCSKPARLHHLPAYNDHPFTERKTA